MKAKRSMGKEKIPGVFLLFFLILGTLLPGAPDAWAALPGKAPAEIASGAEAEAFLQTLFGGNAGELDGTVQLTEQMDAALKQSGGFAGLAKQLASLGTLEQVGTAAVTEGQGSTMIRVPCVFSAMSLDLVLTLQGGKLAGLVTAPYSGEKKEEEPEDFENRELALPSPEGDLPGTLSLPAGEGPFPAVVLIHGSGPCDRDETVGNIRPFRDLARGLAEKGIAVYRFDKRTYVYGAQMAENRRITLREECIEDAAAAVQLLAAQEEIDASRIFVLGHSLGGMALPAIDRELRGASNGAAGYVFLAANARPLEVLMREQYEFLYSLAPEITPEMAAEKESLFAELDRLQSPDTLTEEDRVAGVYAPYWKWLAAYDVLTAAEEITLPCLLLQGEEDYQVTMEDFSLWQEAVEEKENWTLLSLPGLTHTFTKGRRSEGSSVYMKNETVDAQVIGEIAEFVLAH